MSSTDTDGILSVVLDTGSQYLKAGFGGEQSPRCIIPSAIGRFRCAGVTDGYPEISFGQTAITNRGLSKLNWPVREGIVQDWDDLEKLWHHTFYTELHVPPETSKVLHSVHPLVPKGSREKMVELLFESFAVHSINLMRAPVLILHASGRTSGVVYEAGAQSCYSAPVYEGYPLMYSIVPSSITGEALSTRLNTLLSKIGYSFTTPKELDLVDKIKAELCYVAPNFEMELQKSAACGESEVSFELPDGQRIMLGKERFECPEVLFQPALQGIPEPSLVDVIISSIDKCDIDHRAIFFSNMVAAGGSSMFPGLIPRLHKEIAFKLINLPRFKPFIDELPSRHLAEWIGGSIIASLDCFKGFWLTRQDYDDGGSERVKYKFI